MLTAHTVRYQPRPASRLAGGDSAKRARQGIGVIVGVLFGIGGLIYLAAGSPMDRP